MFLQTKQLCQQSLLMSQDNWLCQWKLPELQSVAQSANHQNQIQTLTNNKEKLLDLIGFKTQGALERSRFQNQVEAPFMFIFSCEKKSRRKHFVHGLNTERTRHQSRSSEENFQKSDKVHIQTIYWGNKVKRAAGSSTESGVCLGSRYRWTSSRI